LNKFRATFKGDFFDITVEGESGLEVVMGYLKRKEEIENALKSQPTHAASSPPRKTGPKLHLSIHPSTSPEHISLANLSIPDQVKDAFVESKDTLSNSDTVFLLLHYYPNGLTNKQLRTLSEEMGKLIKFSWLDGEFHRTNNEGLVMSRRVPGRREVSYFLTQLGRKKAQDLLRDLQTKTKPKTD